MSRGDDETLRAMNAVEQEYLLPAFAVTFSHMEQNYPHLVRGVEFARVPDGLFIYLFDKSISAVKPAYRLNLHNREIGMIFALTPGNGMFFPCYSLDDFNVLLSFGMQPPGMIL